MIQALSKITSAFTIIAYIKDKPVGLINAFEGFSTFQCKPLINIHDLVVTNEFRGLGISQLTLEKIEKIAKDKACCKITLEVLEGNKAAQKAYKKFGFAAYELDPAVGKAVLAKAT